MAEVDVDPVPLSEPVLPDYAGPCVTNLVPALLEELPTPSWLPDAAVGARQIVLLVLDGLGWEQLHARSELAPTLCSMSGRSITTVAPSTTATALTSITTGMTPGEHGIVGYRIAVDDEILNVLRWSTERGDARRVIPPDSVQPVEPFGGQRPVVVNRAEFVRSGFSGAHLQGARFRGYRVPSALVTEVALALRAGEPFVYAYYDGIDKVSHEYGLGEFYDGELAAVDRLVADVIDRLPPGAVLVVTSDHGQVETGDQLIEPHSEVSEQLTYQSGEGRFRWLHARPGRQEALLAAACANHGPHAWVRSRDEAIAEGWFGSEVTAEAASRMGDVIMAARGRLAFVDPADSGPFELVGRHGSLTSDEMLVPLVAVAN